MMEKDLGHAAVAESPTLDSVNHLSGRLRWVIGQKVRCIKAGPIDIKLPEHPAQRFQLHQVLEIGKVYTVRALNVRDESNPHLIGSGCGVYLEEVKNPKWPSHDHPDGWLEISYDQLAFVAAS